MTGRLSHVRRPRQDGVHAAEASAENENLVLKFSLMRRRFLGASEPTDQGFP
jgi:hypothetical protein